MSKKRSKKTDEYRLQHNTFFEETFMMPEFGAAFLKKTLPRKLKKRLDIDKLTVEKTEIPRQIISRNAARCRVQGADYRCRRAYQFSRHNRA